MVCKKRLEYNRQMLSILLHTICAAFYGGLAFYFWRTRWAQSHTREAVVSQRFPAAPHGFARWERWTLAIAVAFHGWLLTRDIFGAGEFYFGFAHALSMMSLLALIFYGIESLVHSLEGMPALVLPPAAVSVLLPALFGGALMTAKMQAPAFAVHVLRRHTRF
jgi:ABC-type uncharacterized transport system permease subunit